MGNQQVMCMIKIKTGSAGKMHCRIKLNLDTNVFITIKIAKQVIVISVTFLSVMFAPSVDKNSFLPAQIILAH